MGFELLLGNERLRQNLASSLQKGHISHFYLISGPVGSGKHTLARLLAAAILCGNRGKPCLTCEPCRKVMANTHPDFITIDDPEKKTVPVDLIRQARNDIYIRPNEAEHKIYLFPRAQDMGIPSQNALLKVLEEPPSYGVFILLSDNPEKLLPTVRSRCTELNLLSLPEEILKQAEMKAEDTAKNTETEISLAGKQAVARLKAEISEMIIAKTTSEGIKAATLDGSFLKEMLVAVAKNWNGASAGKVELKALLPEAKRAELDASFEQAAKELLKEGIEVGYSKDVKSGFKVGAKSGGYYISFSDESFDALLKEYLREKVSQMLYKA